MYLSKKEKAAEKLTTALKASSEVVYEAAFDSDVDLEYVVTPTSVKENIILNSASDITSYVTTLSADGLTAVLLEDNSIELANAEGEVKYIIAAPYMLDSLDAESYDFEVTLETDEAGDYIITYTPSIEWLSSADRVYPITVDPTLKSVNSLGLGASNIVDSYVVEGSTTTRYLEDYLYIGKNSSGKKYYSFVRLKSMPSIPAGAEITESRFTLFLDPNRTPTKKAVTVYAPSSTWNSSSITYSNMPNLSTASNYSNIAIRYNSTYDMYYYSFDVTSTVKSTYLNYWATGTMSCGNGFAITHTNLSSGSYDRLCSAEWDDSDWRPYVWTKYYAATEANLADGVYFFKNKGSGRYLDIANGGTTTGTSAVIWDYHGQLNQRYAIKKSGGYYTFSPINAPNTYLSLATEATCNNKTSVVIRKVSSTSSIPNCAKWKIYINNDGTFRIAAKLNLYRTLDCTNNGTAAGTKVQVYTFSGDGNNGQKWYLTYANNKVTSEIDALNKLANDYDAKNGILRTVQFIRYYKDYRGKLWDCVAGEESDFSDFIDYVNDHKSSLNQLQENKLYFHDYCYGTVDLTHLVATANGLLYKTVGGVNFAEDVIDDLCGWAGDLQGLVANTLVETNNSQDYSTIYNKFIEIMGHKDYRFSMEDLLADLDAIYIADNITTTEGIGTQIKGYYNGGACNTRFSYFIDDLSKEELTNKIKTYTNLKYLNIVWPLYKSYNVTSISETQANAMSAAFADYLWNRKEVG